MSEKLILHTPNGIYCPLADVYIDPNRRVENAIITHAHSDHAKKGHKNYLAHRLSIPIMRHRIGNDIKITSTEYGAEITKNGVKISLHPAGHIPGSAQVRLEHKGEVCVVSGDYKLEDDGLSTPFEPVKCHTFITESTFAMPIYKWEKQIDIFRKINNWWLKNIENKKLSILTGYSLGKAQRLFKHVDHRIGKIFGHYDIISINNLFRNAGLELPELNSIPSIKTADDFKYSLVIAPPHILGSDWLQFMPANSIGFASGWMAEGSAFYGRRKNIDAGFAISDHADWDELNRAVKLTGAENIYVTHGFTDIFVKWLNKSGYNAYELKYLGKEEIADSYYKSQLELFGS